MTSNIDITNSDYWFKVVEMLQQNWALIEPTQTACVEQNKHVEMRYWQ